MRNTRKFNGRIYSRMSPKKGKSFNKKQVSEIGHALRGVKSVNYRIIKDGKQYQVYTCASRRR